MGVITRFITYLTANEEAATTGSKQIEQKPRSCLEK